MAKNRSVPFADFFKPMNLTKKQKEERIKAAEDTKEVLLILFLLLLSQKEYGLVDYEAAKQEFISEYTEVVRKYTDYEFAETYVPLVAANLLKTTENNEADEWYFSEDRATLTAENEALSVLNHEDYREAVERGFTRKQWVDMRDERERETHLLIGGSIIPIEQKFHVGNAYLLFPHDYINGSGHMEEIANCRCYVQWLK